MTSFCGVCPILHRIKKCSYGAYGAKDKPGDIPLPRSLTRSARSFGCGERYRLTGGAEISWHLPGRSLTGKQEGHGKAVFHRLRPLTSITKSDAQISGGETRQDLKIPGVSPGGSLVRSPVPAFRFTGVIPLLWPRLSHSTPDTQFREGSSLQAGLYARTPFSPTTTPVPVTINLSPTRKDTTNRHWR